MKRLKSATNRVQISSAEDFVIVLDPDEITKYHITPLCGMMTRSAIHRGMSNTWDKYCIKKVTIKINPADSTYTAAYDKSDYYKIFTAYDITSTAPDIAFSSIKTYDSYKETVFAQLANNQIDSHIVVINTPSRWFSTKTTDFANNFITGVYFTKGIVDPYTGFSELFTFKLRATFQFDVEYKGCRVDESYVKTIMDAISLPPERLIEYVPVPVPLQKMRYIIWGAWSGSGGSRTKIWEQVLFISPLTWHSAPVTYPAAPAGMDNRAIFVSHQPDGYWLARVYRTSGAEIGVTENAYSIGFHTPTGGDSESFMTPLEPTPLPEHANSTGQVIQYMMSQNDNTIYLNQYSYFDNEYFEIL